MSQFLKAELGEVAAISGSRCSTPKALSCWQVLHIACCSLACVNTRGTSALQQT